MKTPVTKSLDVPKVIDHILRDVFKNHVGVFSTLSKSNTLRKFRKRLCSEGMGYLTVTLPAIGRSLDKTLAGVKPFDCIEHDLKPVVPGSKIPKLLGELFERVIHADGTLRKDACVSSIRSLRQVLYLFYKYELPYTHEQEQHVLSSFITTEEDLRNSDLRIDGLNTALNPDHNSGSSKVLQKGETAATILRAARTYLSRLFGHFDPQDIIPRHGPGAVASREQFFGKYEWSCIPERLTDVYPLDAFFCASLGHVCDTWPTWSRIITKEPKARVVLVPKDSRGPRLISCEPVALQWIQQGLRQALYSHVEAHSLSKGYVHFTDQTTNRLAALSGSNPSEFGGYADYATLDLKDASDRVSVTLVKALFPEPLLSALLASRSLSTVLPSGVKTESSTTPQTEVQLRKFAPMGSALCFPILALTIAALLRGAMEVYWNAHTVLGGRIRVIPKEASQDDPGVIWNEVALKRIAKGYNLLRDAQAELVDHRQLHRKAVEDLRATEQMIDRQLASSMERMSVYGDDIIVPRYFAKTAIAALEFFGLKANLDKCCTKGSFRESCGWDAFKGELVTPVRFRTVWETSSSAEVYTSWLSYANSLYTNGYQNTAVYIAGKLYQRFGRIPTNDPLIESKGYPCIDANLALDTSIEQASSYRGEPFKRFNSALQKAEEYVLYLCNKSTTPRTSGWPLLFRYLTEASDSFRGERAKVGSNGEVNDSVYLSCIESMVSDHGPVCVYTLPRSSILKRGWR